MYGLKKNYSIIIVYIISTIKLKTLIKCSEVYLVEITNYTIYINITK